MTVAYPHITVEPGVAEGRPCVGGTGVRVTEIFSAAESGINVSDLQTRFAGRPLTTAEIHAALAYYHDNRDELEALRVADEEAVADARREHLAAIKRRFMGEE